MKKEAPHRLTYARRRVRLSDKSSENMEYENYVVHEHDTAIGIALRFDMP